jgi:phosphoribosylaminoimidazolecarboxamide formyltransferase/IMP cyclohydrolase
VIAMSDDVRPLRRALLSVADKHGLETLARRLTVAGVALLSTGGTRRALAAAGISTEDVAAYTDFPEMMDGRVKTLHPRVHGGILGRRGVDDAVMRAHGIEPIDLVVVNLYPFAATVARPGVTQQEAVEQIDIGGPAMVRSAAKNHADVAVVVDPADYETVADAVERQGGLGVALRRRLAAKAFAHTAAYDAAIARYLAPVGDDEFPRSLELRFERIAQMRYGENPHQHAALYREPGGAPAGTVTGARQLHGKALSYNNVADTDAALQCVAAFAQPACVIVKHANPCGVAVAGDLLTAYERAYATDRTSAFGGIIAFNRALDATTLARVLERQFVEVVVAPAVDQDALAAAVQKKNLRVLECGELGAGARGWEFKRVGGGLLVQTPDSATLDASTLRVVSERRPVDAELADLRFAWIVACFVKSNAIVYARDGRTIGIGAGQTSRVVSAKIAVMKAQEEGLDVRGAVMASDAFFPFRDGIDAAAAAGIRAVIQPGGSVRDEEVVAAVNEHGMAMVFTGVRHFRH